MLFLLAIEPLSRLFQNAQDRGLLSKQTPRCESFRMSLYINDVAVFIKPNKRELQIIRCILDTFAQASGPTNMTKTEFYPIKCTPNQLEFLSQENCVLSSFAYIYLGLPLHFGKPTKFMMQPVIEKIGNRLSEWKKNFLHTLVVSCWSKGCCQLCQPIFLTVFKMTKWGISQMDKFRRRFL
jgi:hypothetical protein